MSVSLMSCRNTELLLRPTQVNLSALGINYPSFPIQINSILSPKLISYWSPKNELESSACFYWIELDEPIAHRYTWFAKAGDWILMLDSIIDPPIEPTPAAQTDAKADAPKFLLPGLPEEVSLFDPICVVNQTPVRFYWSDATQQGSVLPDTPKKTFNIQEAARMMDRFQSLFPTPIDIHYWLLLPNQNYMLTGEIDGPHNQGQAVIWSLRNQKISVDEWKTLCMNHRLGGVAATDSIFSTDIGPTRHWLFQNSPIFTYMRY